MKVLFVYPEIRKDIPDFTGYYAEGPAVLSAVLKKAGHETDLLHLTRHREPAGIKDEIARRGADLVAFTSLSPMYGEVRRLAPIVRAATDAPIVYGGVHSTLDPEGSIATEGIDAIANGEGEETIVELAKRVARGEPFDDVHGLWVKVGGDVRRNPSRRLVANLDDIPMPDFELFDLPRLFNTKEGVAMMTGSRGCPYKCSYCSNHKQMTSYPNKGDYVRVKSVDRTIAEARRLLSLSNEFKYFDFSDDIFILNLPFLTEFAERFPVEIGRPFVCNTLVTLVDEERTALLRKAGCTMVTFGLESGSERMRDEILDRPPMSDQRILEAAQTLKRHGIKIATYNMIGLPTETIREVFESIEMNAALAPSKINHFIFQPYPKTNLYKLCVDLGLYDGIGLLPSNWRETSILDQKQLTQQQLLFLHRYFGILVRICRLVLDRPWALEALKRIVEDGILKRPWLISFSVRAHESLLGAAKVVYVKGLRGLVNRRAREFSQAEPNGSEAPVATLPPRAASLPSRAA